MSRPLRISYPGTLYHITARGNEKNLIYIEKGDYCKFLKILSYLPKSFIEKIKRKIKKQREIPESRRLAKRIKYKGVIAILTKRLRISEQKNKRGRTP